MKNIPEDLIIKHKKRIVKQVQVYFRNNPQKCTRDLNFLINAILHDIVNNTKEATLRNASKFWHRDELLINDLESKIPVYNQIRDYLKKLMEENGFLDESNKIDELFELNELVLREGSVNPAPEQIWQDRRNFTKFLTDVEVPQYLENHLDTCILETPIQKDNYIAVCKLTNKDQEIKDYLVEHCLISPQGLHMVAVSTAPLVYIVLLLENSDIFLDKNIRAVNKVIDIHGGVMMAETLRHGFDFSFIGCATDNIEKSKEDTWKNMIKDRFGLHVNSKNPWPEICWCIGVGDSSVTEQYNNTYELFSGKIVREQIFNKKSIKKKPNILFE